METVAETVDFKSIKEESKKGPIFLTKDEKVTYVKDHTPFYITNVFYKENAQFGPQWNLTIELTDGDKRSISFRRDGGWQLGQNLVTALMKANKVGLIYLAFVKYNNGRSGYDLVFDGEDYTPGNLADATVEQPELVTA